MASATLESLSKSTPGSVELRQNDEIPSQIPCGRETPGADHTRLSGFHSKSSACRCLDMPSQLVQGLVAVLDGAEADRPVALCFGRIQLPQRDHGLAVALLIERNRGAKTAWIVIHVRTVINLDQVRRLDAPQAHSIRKSLAVWGEHVEAPHAADANVDLLGFALEPRRPEPVRQMLRFCPGSKDDITLCLDDTRQNDLVLDIPVCDAGLRSGCH